MYDLTLFFSTYTRPMYELVQSWPGTLKWFPRVYYICILPVYELPPLWIWPVFELLKSRLWSLLVKRVMCISPSKMVWLLFLKHLVMERKTVSSFVFSSICFGPVSCPSDIYLSIFLSIFLSVLSLWHIHDNTVIAASFADGTEASPKGRSETVRSFGQSLFRTFLLRRKWSKSDAASRGNEALYSLNNRRKRKKMWMNLHKR